MEELALGILVGMGIVVIGKKVFRPALKGTIRAAMFASEATQNALHRSRERLSDLAARARREMESARDAAQAEIEIEPGVQDPKKSN